MDDFGSGLGLEALLPGGDEGGTRDDLAGRVDGTDVFENSVCYLVFGSVGHVNITA